MRSFRAFEPHHLHKRQGPTRMRSRWPLFHAGVAKTVNAADLGSAGEKSPWEFESPHPHYFKRFKLASRD